MLKKRQISEQHDNRNNKRQQSVNEQISSTTNLQKCSICNRRFNQHRLIEHEQACKGTKQTKDRYHYDSQMHRWKGLDYGTSLNRSTAKRQKLQSSTKHFPKTRWREKHQQFQGAIKGQYDSINESSDDRPYQCSQCQRKFATENAITKHRKGCTGTRQIGIKSRHMRNKS